MEVKVKKLLILPSLLVIFTMISGIILASINVNAEDSGTSSISVSVSISCSITSTLDSAHSATINPATYQDDIGTTTIKVFCNDNAGFAVYAIGYSNEEYGNNKLIATVGGTLAPSYDITTGTAISGNVSNWAMKLAPVTGTYAPTIVGGYTQYSEIPTTYTKVATLSSVTDLTIGSEMTTTYQVFINGLQPAGSYVGKVKYTLVHPNDADAPTPPAAMSCTTPVPNLTYMQDLTSSNKSSILASMTEDAQYYLKDKRDEKTYCVSKLKDSNIWMTQNLDHDISTSFSYTPANTDIPANWTPDKSTYTTGTTTWGTGTTDYNIQQSYDPGDKIWDGTLDPDYSTTLDNMTQGTDTHYHIGNYYNFGAAVAMNDTSSYTTKNQDLDQSICPAGWTLPKSGNNTSNGSFSYMLNLYGLSSREMTNPHMWESPLYFPLSGGWGGARDSVGSGGAWWSPVVESSSRAYVLRGNNLGRVNPNLSYYRSWGSSVRCVSR